MPNNLDRFKKDLDALIAQGDSLELSMQLECFPEEFAKKWKEATGKDVKEDAKSWPVFGKDYQSWYSEALALIRQMLPHRLDDFVRHYEKPRGRKELSNENYRIEDYLQGLTVSRGAEMLVNTSAAIPHFRQQVAILKAAAARFESSLFEIKQLVQADLFDSELAVAEELANHKFVRAAGAVAGVVLEKHLAQVCGDHKIAITKKHPTIGDFNEALKGGGVVDVPGWRFIQHLADIRNLCDHGRAEPTPEQVADLIEGAKKVTKTIS